ncbi:MAG: glycosyltransferase family 4 protein [Pseudomonadota bacterium]
MKILFLISSMEAGGAERVAATLCNAWAARGDQVMLVPTYSGGGVRSFYALDDAVQLRYLAQLAGVTGRGALNYLRRLRCLRALIAQRAPDVIISFLPNVSVNVLLASAGMRVPVIVCERRDPSSQSHSYLQEWACRLLYRRADMVTVQTEAVAAKIRAIYPGPYLLRAVPNPLPELALAPAAADRPRKVLLSLGRLVPEKQLDRLLDAFHDLAPAHPDWDLHIYGDGPLAPKLAQRIAALGLNERVALKGRTERPWDAMAGADAFVMTSKFEGFPNALLEAMGMALPCVAFDCPSGPREMSADGRDAMLVALDDQAGLSAALGRLMGEAPLRSELGARARASVLARFGLPGVLARWDGLFAELGVRA